MKEFRALLPYMGALGLGKISTNLIYGHETCFYCRDLDGFLGAFCELFGSFLGTFRELLQNLWSFVETFWERFENFLRVCKKFWELFKSFFIVFFLGALRSFESFLKALEIYEGFLRVFGICFGVFCERFESFLLRDHINEMVEWNVGSTFINSSHRLFN